MKKIISLCLAVVMLLGLVAMTASANETPAFTSYYVALGDTIALKFEFTGLAAGTEYACTIDGEDATVKADAEGVAVVVYDALTPAMIENEITVTLTVDETTTLTATKSVMDYCNWALNNMDNSNELFTLVVDLLNYAAATQAYVGAEATANAGLTDLQKMLATATPTIDAEYLSAGNEDGATVTWTGASIVLSDSIAYKFCLALDENYAEDVIFVVTLNGNTFTYNWENAFWTEEDGFFVVFTALTPADLRSDLTIVAQDEEGNALSSTWTFSGERYSNYVVANESEEAAAVVVAMMAYADSAAAYIDDVANTNTIVETELTLITESDKFDLYRKIMNLATLEAAEAMGNQIGGHVNAIYSAVGLNVVSEELYGKKFDTWSTICGALFDSVPLTSSSGDPATRFKTSEDEGYILNFHKLLVDKSWGGGRVNIVDGETAPDYPLSTIDLQIGDLIVMKHNTSDFGANAYITLLYQGNDTFIGAMNKSSSSNKRYIPAINAEQVNKILTKSGTAITAYSSSNDKYTYTTSQNSPYGYFVIRPSQLLTNAG